MTIDHPKLIAELRNYLPTQNQKGLLSHPDMTPWLIAKLEGRDIQMPFKKEDWDELEKPSNIVPMGITMMNITYLCQHCKLDKIMFDGENNTITIGADYHNLVANKEIKAEPSTGAYSVPSIAHRINELTKTTGWETHLHQAMADVRPTQVSKIKTTQWNKLSTETKELLELHYGIIPIPNTNTTIIQPTFGILSTEGSQDAQEISKLWEQNYPATKPPQVSSNRSYTKPCGLLIIANSKKPINGRPTLTREQLCLKDQQGIRGWEYAAITGRLTEAVNLWPNQQEAERIIRTSNPELGIAPIELSLQSGRSKDTKQLLSLEEARQYRWLQLAAESGAIIAWADQLNECDLNAPDLTEKETILIRLIKNHWGGSIPKHLQTKRILHQRYQNTWIGAELLRNHELPNRINIKDMLHGPDGKKAWDHLETQDQIGQFMINVKPEYMCRNIDAAKQMANRNEDTIQAAIWYAAARNAHKKLTHNQNANVNDPH